MGILFFILCITFMVFGLLFYKIKYNPINIFNLWWLLYCFLSLFNVSGIDAPSNNVFLILIIGLLTFNLVFMFYNTLLESNEHKRKYSLGYDYKNKFNVKGYKIIIGILIVYYLINSIVPIQMLLTGSSLAEIRSYYFLISDGSRSELLYYLETYMIIPLFYCVIVNTFVKYFFIDKKKSSLYSLLILLILYTINTGGRYMIFNTLIAGIFAVIICNSLSKYKIKLNSYLIFIIFVLVFVMIYVTTNRNSNDLGLLAYADVYFRGSITYFSKILDIYDVSQYRTYGLNFIMGGVNPIISFFRYIRIIEYPNILNVITEITGNQIYIGNGIRYNAFTSMFFYFYIDGGLFGVFFETLIFSLIVTKIYSMLKKRSYNLIILSIYLLLIIQLNNTTARYMLYLPSYFLSYIYMYLVFFKRIKRRVLDV